MLDSSQQTAVDVLADEYVTRLRAGEAVDIESYAVRWPQLAGEIRELFPAAQAMERLKRRRQRAADDAQLPQKIGDFRVLREIGRGGMGIVYEAVQESLDRRVALKVLPRPMWNERRLRRFRREARTAAKLHHTNIVPVLGVGEDEGHQFIVMQYIRGVGLDDVIAALQASQGSRLEEEAALPAASAAAAGMAHELSHSDSGRGFSGSLSGWQTRLWKNIAHIGAQAAEALHYAHQQGTTHRDIKPANLLLDEKTNVWVADFGLAIQQEATQSHDIVGTLRYMAPEQLSGDSDPRSDIYSLGLTLYELVTLQPAFDDQERREQFVHGRPLESPPSPGSVCDCPRDLETIILKATAVEPVHRYRTARDLADDLRAFIEHRPILARRVTLAERTARWCRRNKPLAAATALAAVLLITVAATATVAYYRTRALAVQAQRSLDAEKTQRQLAESTLEISLETLDRIYRRFAPDRLRDQVLAVPSGDDLQLMRSPITQADAAMLEEMLQVYDRFAEQQADSRRLAEEAAQANWRVAEIHRSLGNYDRAERACGRAIALYRRLADELWEQSKLEPPLRDARDPRLAMARVYNELGMTRAAQGEFRPAADAHHQALRQLDASALPSASGTAADTDTPLPEAPDHRLELARTDYLLMLAQPDATRGGAARQLRRAIPILERLALAERDAGDARYLLAVCYAARENDPFGPLTEEAMVLLEQLVTEFPQQPDYRLNLAVTYARGDVDSMFQRKRLEERLRRALSHSRVLVAEHPNVRDYVQAHAHILRRLGALLSRKVETMAVERQRPVRREAEQLLRLAVDHQTTLADRFPEEPRFNVLRARIQNLLADHLVRSGKHREAQGCCERVVRQLYGLPPDPQTHGILTRTYTILADAHAALGEHGEETDARDNAKFHEASSATQQDRPRSAEAAWRLPPASPATAASFPSVGG